MTPVSRRFRVLSLFLWGQSSTVPTTGCVTDESRGCVNDRPGRCRCSQTGEWEWYLLTQ